MRLVLDSDPRLFLVRRYGEGAVVIGEQTLTQPFIVSPQQLLPDWPVHSIEQLTETELQPLLATGAKIVLLGAGSSQPFASKEVRALCRARGVALECMNLGAACRTYNILANEERSVAAGLFPADA